jgi:hypothetical protein
MSAIKGPNIITTGLVISLDAANIQSFRGEPTTNLVSNHIVGDYGNSPGSTNNTVSPDGSNNATIPIPNATADRYQKTIAGGAHPSGTQFTYTWHYKQLGPHLGTVPNEPGGLQITGLVNCTLVGTATKLYDLNDGWSRWKATFQIVNGSLESIFRLYFGHVIGIDGNSAAYYGHQFEQKPYATPLVSGTRGSTVATGGGWADQSGSGNHGELVNGPTFSDDNSGSIVFDGTNDHITVNVNSWIRSASSAYTFSSFFYYNGGSNGGAPYSLMTFPNDNNNNDGFWQHLNLGNWLWRAEDNVSGETGGNVEAPSTFLNGNWYHIATVVKTNSLIFYRNGLLVSTISTSFNWANLRNDGTAYLYISTGYGENYYMNGNIGIFQMYNRELSAAEIIQNYNATKGRYGL